MAETEARGLTRTTVRLIGVVATIGMFIVLVMGATVTSTGSAEGCGRSWPLCNGQFIPAFAVATLIEFSHRAVTGIEGILILAFAVGVRLYWWNRREVKILTAMMVFFLLLQAWLGAAAVMWPQSKAVLALHFGISLIAFASVFLLTAFVRGVDGWDRLRDAPVPTRFRWATWGTMLYVYGVVYLGAYVRHTKTSLACSDWPLCNGQLFPGFDGLIGPVFAHRLAAGGALIIVGGLFLWARSFRGVRPDLYHVSAVTLGLVSVQAISGAIIVFSRLHLFSALAHAALMSLIFLGLSYLCLQVLPHASGATAKRDSTRLAGATPR